MLMRSSGAYLAASAEQLQHPGRWVAMVGALTVNPGLLEAWRADVLAWRAADEAENADPIATAIVRLAADGLWLVGVLGLPGPGPSQEARILAELNQMTRKPRPEGPQ